MKKMPTFLKIILGIIGVIVIVIIAATLIVNSQMNAKEIKLGSDTVPTVNAIVGKRSVSSISAEKDSDDITIKTITYKVDGDDEKALSTSDIETYIEELENQGYLVTKSFTITSPTAQLGIESNDNGQIVRIDIEFDRSSSEAIFKYTKAAGALTR